MTENTRKYEFSWDTLGSDMALARPSLGDTLKIEVYRLLQFTMRDIIEQEYGTQAADDLFYKSGVLAGKSFYDQFLTEFTGSTETGPLVRRIGELFRDLGIGIFRVESFDNETMQCYVTVDEDLDCSGLPDIEDVICIYDEGFIAGILEKFTGKVYSVKEVDCWCTGARTCRFQGMPVE